MSWGAVIGGAVSLIGGGMAARGAKKDRRLMQSQIDRLNQVEFQPFGVTGLGGTGFQYDRGGRSTFTPGAFGGLFDRFVTGAESDIDLGRNLQSLGDAAIPGLMAGMGQAGQLGDISFAQAGDLAFGGFRRGLQDRLFGAAGDSLGRMQRGFGDIRDEYLGLLRERAAPQEQRTQDQLLDRLHRMGITRSTGGQRAFESFGEGLGRADLDRQLASFDLADRARMQEQGQLESLLGAGGSLRGMEEDLLQSAFNRFGGTMGLVGDLSSGIFNRGGARINQAFQNLGGASNIQRMLMQLGEFGANLEQSRVDTDIRAAGGAAQAVSNLGASSGDIWGGFLGSLGSNLSTMDLFGRDDQGFFLGSQRGRG